MINSLFLDTNILLRSVVASAPEHSSIQNVLAKLSENKVIMWISRQVLREFLANMTRPQTYMQPTSPDQLLEMIRLFQKQYQVADENSLVTNKLLELLEKIPMGGKQIHDANIVATIQTYGIADLLRLNVVDFNRFSNDIKVWSIGEILTQFTKESGNDGE